MTARHAHSGDAAAASSGARVTVSASGTLVPNRGSTVWSGLRAVALARHTSTATKATRGIPADMPHAEGRLGVALAGSPLGFVAAPFSAPVAARPACAGRRPFSSRGDSCCGSGIRSGEGQAGRGVAWSRRSAGRAHSARSAAAPSSSVYAGTTRWGPRWTTSPRCPWAVTRPHGGTCGRCTSGATRGVARPGSSLGRARPGLSSLSLADHALASSRHAVGPAHPEVAVNARAVSVSAGRAVFSVRNRGPRRSRPVFLSTRLPGWGPHAGGEV